MAGGEVVAEFSWDRDDHVITVFPAVVDDPDFALLVLLACLAIQREERLGGIVPGW